MQKITKNMTVTEILQMEPMVYNILARYGMSCLFCGAALHESLAQACAVHGYDEEQTDVLVDQINDFIGADEAE